MDRELSFLSQENREGNESFGALMRPGNHVEVGEEGTRAGLHRDQRRGPSVNPVPSQCRWTRYFTPTHYLGT